MTTHQINLPEFARAQRFDLAERGVLQAAPLRRGNLGDRAWIVFRVCGQFNLKRRQASIADCLGAGPEPCDNLARAVSDRPRRPDRPVRAA
jgi:hypothetical protein